MAPVPQAARLGRAASHLYRGSSRPLMGAAALMFGLFLTACTTGPLQPVTPILVDAARTARLISSYRAENGLGAVGVDSRLMQAAASHARAMGEHDRINHRIGGSLAKRVSAVGYDWGVVVENLGAGYSSVEDAMQGWTRSPGHRRNLLDPHASEIGIAAVATPAGSEHRNYWALILATPRPELTVTGPFAWGQVR